MAQTLYALDPEHNRWLIPQDARGNASSIDLEASAKARFERENDAQALVKTLAGLPAKAGSGDAGSYKRPFGMSGKVAIIPIVGPMARYSSYDWWSGSYTRGTADIMASIAAANEDAAVNSILLYMDSPGGTVDGTSELYNAVLRSGKPVHAAIAGTCASAAYWVASACSKIFSTSPNNAVGSIGVYILHSDYSKMMEMVGIAQTYVTSTGSVDKVVAPDNAPLSEEDRAKLVASIDAIRDNFKADVTKGRKGVSLNEAVWTGRAVNSTLARTYGLVDGIKANLSDIVREAQASGTQASKPKKDKEMSLLSRLLGTDEPSADQQAAITQLKAEVAASEAEHRKSAAEAALAATRATEAEAKVKTLEASIAEANTKADAALKQAADAKVALDTANAALEASKADADAKSKELEAANASIETLKAQLAAATTPDPQAPDPAKLKAEYEAKAKEVEAAKAALDAANAALANAGKAVPAAQSTGASDNPPPSKPALSISKMADTFVG